MKKLALVGILVLLATTSCNSVKKAETAQNDRAEYLKLKGEWQISSVNHNQNLKVKPFDEGADSQCFVGSVWRLIPNNYTGSYSLNGGGDCPSVTRPIKFEVKNGNTFLFKKIADGTKAKQNEAGYSMTLVNQTSESFTLQQSVPFEGEIVNVTYNFVRTGK